MNTNTPIREWQRTAIRQALAVFKKKNSKLGLTFGTHIELDEIDLLIPEQLLTTVHSEVCTQIAEKRAEISGILESGTRAEWLEKKNKKQGVIDENRINR